MMAQGMMHNRSMFINNFNANTTTTTTTTTGAPPQHPLAQRSGEAEIPAVAKQPQDLGAASGPVN